MTTHKTVTAVSVSKATGETSVKTEEWPDCLPAIIKDGPKFEGTDVCVQNLFTLLDNGWNLYAFLKLFPSVTAEQALAAIEEKVSEDTLKVMHSDGRIMSGTPVFKGTRLPVKSLFDHMAAGYSLDAWLSQFPTASKEQATTALHLGRYALESIAYQTDAPKPKFRNPPIKRRETPPSPPPKLS